MNGHTPMDPGSPGVEPPERHLEHAVELALRAPSLHNTQPWRWRLGAGRVELHADTNRRLHDTDADRRDLLISCGAALHHLRVALAEFGIAVEIDRFPDSEDRNHLATVRVVPGVADQNEATLFPAIGRRRTDRRAYRCTEVPAATLTALQARARRHGALLHPIVREDVRAAVDALLGEAADAQRHRPGYITELMTWTRRYAAAHDGIPVWSRPRQLGRPDDPFHRFPPGRLVGPSASVADSGLLVVLATADDDEHSRLAAGEATSAVLLAATRAGLATAPLSQALELPQTRHRLARQALHIPDHPQLIIRVGYPADERELTRTPRRPLASVLEPR